MKSMQFRLFRVSLWQSLFSERIRGVRLLHIVLVVLVAIILLWVTFSKVQGRNDVEKLTKLKAELAQEEKIVNDLKLKVASLERPERLEELARNELGLTATDPKSEAMIDHLSKAPLVTNPPATDDAKGAGQETSHKKP